MRGTPKTLIEAIQNGLTDASAVGLRPSEAIEQAVLDYLRQKFAVAYLSMGELSDIVGMEILQELARRIGVERE